MKILQVNVVYKKGSTGKITESIHSGLLNKGIESIVCYGRGDNKKEKYVYKLCPEWYAKFNKLISMITGVMYNGCIISTSRLISIIKKEKPNIVHLQCINGNFVNIYRLIKWLKRKKINTVLTLHAEFMYTGGCGHSIDCSQWSAADGCMNYRCPRWRSETKSLFFDRTGTMWRLMKKTFSDFDEKLVITSVSPWLMERARVSSILSDKVHNVVLNGVNVTIFHPYEGSEMLKARNGLLGKKVILHVTPCFDININHPKGGYFVVKVAETLTSDDVVIVVVGAYVEDVIVPKNVILLGQVNNQVELAKLYSMANITLLTSIRETFSMVTAESLCCGTPVVGFKAGGPEQIALNGFCEFVEYGNINALNGKISSLLNKEKSSNIAQIALEEYSVDRMVNNYINIYSEMVSV